MTEPVLENVPRAHGPAEAVEACDRLVGGGLIVNIDLIYGLPGQTEAELPPRLRDRRRSTASTR